MGLSSGVEAKQKQLRTQYPTHVSPPPTGSPVAGVSLSYPTRVNCGTYQPGASIRVDGAETRLVQNNVSINCGG